MRGAYRLIPWRVAALTAAVTLTVSACGGAAGDPEPTVERPPSTTVSPPPPPEPSPSIEPSPSPSLRAMPPESMELSEAGALAFLAWWVDMYNYVEATGETDLVFQHSEPGCTFCQNTVQDVDSIYGSGGRIERAGGFTFIDAEAERIDQADYVVVTALISSGPANTVSYSGEIIRQSPGTDPPIPVAIGLQWSNDAWMLVDVGTEVNT